MEKDVKVCENEMQISEELLTSFAKFLALLGFANFTNPRRAKPITRHGSSGIPNTPPEASGKQSTRSTAFHTYDFHKRTNYN